MKTTIEQALAEVPLATKTNLTADEKNTYALMIDDGFEEWEILARCDEARKLEKLAEMRAIRGD